MSIPWRLLMPVWLIFATARAAGAETFAPLIDHHQHLLSPAVARMVDGPPQRPVVVVPPDLAEILTTRATAWDNAERLAGLYTDNALASVTGGGQAGFVRGARATAAHLVSLRHSPYWLAPTAYGVDRTSAWVAGYYVAGQPGQRAADVGQFQLGLRRNSAGWRIAVESPAFRSTPAQKPITGADLIKLLDDAGIARAVVLSTAFAYGSRSFDFERSVRKPSELRALVTAANDWTANEAARFPARLIAFCSVSPTADYALDEVRRCGANGRFAGLKLHLDESEVSLQSPDHASRLRAVFSLANASGLAIAIHLANTRSYGADDVKVFLAEIATAAPDVPIQIAHLWGGGRFSSGALDAFANAVQTRAPGTSNLWFDMAEAPLMAAYEGDDSAMAAQAIAAAIRKIGPSRILFGSDIAIAGHKAPKAAWAQFLESIPLTDVEFQIIAGNAAPYLRAWKP